MSEIMNESVEIGSEKVSSIPNLSEFRASCSKSFSRRAVKSAMVSIIKSKTSNRITISSSIMERLSNPQKVQISFNHNSIAIGKKLPNNYNSFNINISSNKGTIYAKQLVREINEVFNLDFRYTTSLTFHDVKYISNYGYVIAIIKIA